MRRRLKAAVLACAMAVVLAGCNLEVESYLIPPSPQGDQGEIAEALEDYVAEHADKGARLTLRYPNAGSYTSAFILMSDLQQRPSSGTLEDAAYAIAFYQTGSDGSPIHVNLLHRGTDGWESIGDVEGLTTDIDRVEFGDLDGDNVPEMLLGWSIYNSQDRQLHVYSFSGETLSVVSTDSVYTEFYVGNATDAGRDDLLLVRIGSGNRVTAQLKTLREGRLEELGSTRIDGFVQRFGRIQTGQLADGVRGIYIDMYKDGGTLVTELLYWDGTRLHAPFYDAGKNVTTATARDSGIPSMDIDGDGEIEFPQSTLLPGYEDEADTKEYMWLTDWYAWDYETGTVLAKASGPSLVNRKDGYCVWLEEGWRGSITTDYTRETRTLWIRPVENGNVGQAFLALRVTDDGETVDVEGEALQFQTWGRNDAIGRTYSVWYDEAGPFDLDTLKIQHMLSQLTV